MSRDFEVCRNISREEPIVSPVQADLYIFFAFCFFCVTLCLYWLVFFLAMTHGWLILTSMQILSRHWSLKDRGRYVCCHLGYC